MLTTAKPIISTLRIGAAAGVLAVVLSACGTTNWGFPYRPDIQQGNWITSEQVAQLQQGMSREQVRFILGTPTLQDVFRTDRWDYPYYNKPGYGREQERKFTVWFEGDSLVRWDGDQQPDRQPFQKADTGMKKDGTLDTAPQNETERDQGNDKAETGTDSEPQRTPSIFNAEPQPVPPGAPVPGRDTAEPLR